MRKLLLLIASLLLLLSPALQAQSVLLEGTVTASDDGTPLPGVNVQLKGSTKGTTTDIHGRFTLDIKQAGELVFSFIGYQSKTVATSGNGDRLKVSLEGAQSALNEVVVTALGISKQKKSLGYAVQEVKGASISEAKESNLVNALAGKVAGVRVTNSQGDMGSARIVIRGETSISGNNQPLFIVDGVPVDNSQLGYAILNSGSNGSTASRDFANVISDLNAEDIESLSVLKGPNAAALYGSRAAHGVVLIKTKTGKSKKGGIGVTVNSNTVFSTLQTLPTYQNIFGQGANGQFSYVDGAGAGVNDNVDESWGPKMDGRLIPQFNSNGKAVPFVPHPDNVRDFFRTGIRLDNGVALADAGDKYDYRLSYNNTIQKGIIPNSQINKSSFVFKTSFKLTPRLTLNAFADYFVTDAPNVPGTGGRRATATMLQFTWFGRQVDMNALRPYKDASGKTFNWNNAYYSNPFWVANENIVQQRRDHLLGSVGLNYKLTDHLSANFRTGNDYYTDRRKQRVAYGTSGTPYGSYEEDGFTVNENNTEGTLNYNKNLNHDLTLDVLAGGNIRVKNYEENYQGVTKLAVANVYTLTNTRETPVSSNYTSKLKQYGLFGSAQLGFRNYAFLNVTARNDWSSTLPPAHQSYFYPSVNAGLILTEAFHIKSDVLNYAKLRGGWSKVGSDAEPYQLGNIYTFGQVLGGNPTLTSGTTNLNPNLRSESTTSTELGLEASFFNNRAFFDVSVYNTNSFNQILAVDVSASTGYLSSLLNAGKINNKGLEVQLGVTPVVAKDFRWEININAARNVSKVLRLDDEGRLQNYVLGTYRGAQIVAGVGKAYGTILGNAYQRDDNGNIVIDAKGIPVTAGNKKEFGKFSPDWIGGIYNTFSYKGFSLGFLVDASVGGHIFAGTNSTGSYTGVLASTLPGRDAAHGGLTYHYAGNNTGTNAVAGAGAGAEVTYDDGMVYKGVTADGKANAQIISASKYYKAPRNIEEQYIYRSDYVKLREVRLSYRLPATWLQRTHFFTDATLSAVGRNLWIIYKATPNIDPENAFNTGNAQGLEDLSVPTTRSYGFNLNFKF